MIDDVLFNKTENTLKEYYKDLRKVRCLKKEEILLTKQLESIREKYKSNNFNLECYPPGGNYSERVQSSGDGTSIAERDLLMKIDRLEVEEREIKKRLFDIDAEIRAIGRRCELLNAYIEELDFDKKTMLKERYIAEKNHKDIAIEIDVSEVTYHKMRKLLIEDIAKVLGFI